MKILLSPIIDGTSVIKYSFEGDVITAEYKGVTDTFDLSSFTEDGELQVNDADGIPNINTDLEYVPIRGAERRDGVLYVTLIHFIDGTNVDELYPEWIDAEDYITPSDPELETADDPEEEGENE